MGAVGPRAMMLGAAGLLPQAFAVALVMISIDPRLGGMLALVYGGLILSFLGGIWWGIAMRRTHRQGRLAALSVLPSLAVLAIIVARFVGLPLPVALVLLGSAILLTLLVDRHLVRTGEAPAGWMRLRVPLSLGLGGLTILAALI